MEAKLTVCLIAGDQDHGNRIALVVSQMGSEIDICHVSWSSGQ